MVLLLSCLVLAIAVVTVASASARASRAELAINVDADALLAQARGAVTFDIAEPKFIPDGFRLINVIWSEPSVTTGATHSSVDLWYQDDIGQVVHLWQTDIPPAELGTKDPTLKGSTTAIDQRDWTTLEQVGFFAARLTVLSSRMPDGTTVSLDGPAALSELAQVAASLWD